jgi:hypothetical protein
MHQTLVVPFLAPVPTGHRVQLIRAQRWKSPLFGGQPAWRDVTDPIIVDRDTGVVYVGWELADHLIVEPLGFKPNTGHQIASLTEARVTSCMVMSEGGDRAVFKTTLMLEMEPRNYRQ